MSCAHLVEATGEATPQAQECIGCHEEARTNYVHLRLCVSCGYVGCCDSSPSRHATAHHHATSHPVMRSFEDGESWRWCYVDEVLG